MLHSLWFRLVGALAAVIVVTLVVVTAVSTLVTERQFDLYSAHSGDVWAAQVAPIIAEQYRQDGDWSQAQAILENPWLLRSGAAAGGMMGPGMHMGGPPYRNMWGQMNIHLLLVDSSGRIVADSESTLTGQLLTPDLSGHGTPVLLDGQQVGTLIAVPVGEADRLAENRDFLSTINRAVGLAALAAGLAALLLGTLLFRRITRPLAKLEEAARTVGSGELAHRVAVTSNDEIGTLAKAFNQMATQLESQQQLRKEMVADVAHELRTPLSVVQGTIEALQDGVLKPTKAELASLHREIRRLNRLVDDLRTLSLAEAGQLKLEMMDVDAGKLATEVAAALKPAADERGVTLESRVDPAAPHLQGDEDRLAEVLHNLVTNALRYTPAGGRVTIAVRSAGGRLEMAVTDTGAGIAPEDLPFVFERFWRGDRSRSRASGGSGIGLAIVRQLVTLHGGTITVESQVGQGTTFRIVF